MENTYVIPWTSKLRASCGQGKKLFTREEAEQLAEELNRDYPDFVHEPLDLHRDESASGEHDGITADNMIDLSAELSSSSSSIALATLDAEIA